MKLNLGSCDDVRPGYLNVDRDFPVACPMGDRFVWDLMHMPWPWADSSVDEIFARDIFEHLPDKGLTMDESWRVLRPGGLLHIIVPTVGGIIDGQPRFGWGAFRDPDHKSWWTPDDLLYYTVGVGERERFRRRAGFTVESKRHFVAPDPNVTYLEAKLRAVK